jgi:hypothetical protein
LYQSTSIISKHTHIQQSGFDDGGGDHQLTVSKCLEMSKSLTPPPPNFTAESGSIPTDDEVHSPLP